MTKLPLTLILSAVLGSVNLFADSHTHPASRMFPVPGELNLNNLTEKTTASNFQAKRTEPVFRGAFSVGLVLISFPDTKQPSREEVERGLFNFGSMSVTDYYKEYSQGVAWPELFIIGANDYEKAVYKAPKPKGYYCEFDNWDNPLGYQDGATGHQRAAQLRADAERHAYSYYQRPPNVHLQGNGKPNITCFVYMTDLVPQDDFKKVIRPYYGNRKMSYDNTKEAWLGYNPAINWSDPLWPNSIPQIHASGGGGTLCHELGHVMGAPDFYHAPERYDGIPGTPCLSWAYGPTGPGYCRYIYNAYLPRTNYPTYTKSGTYTLAPRKTNPAGNAAVGCFIPSTHPHYVYCLEYVKDEKEPLGNPGKQGLLIQVINVTLTSPLLGTPDLCYVYRPNDPYFRDEGQLDQALFGSETERTSFDMTTEPASRLPNLMDGGLSITNIVESSAGVTFTATLTPHPMTPSEYKDSLIPKVSIDEVNEVLPTSFHARCTITFRGEPMKQDYGFCWNTTPKPTIQHNFFPLYHRDRYDARILSLRPNTKYYVRAYARNSQGVSYSAKEASFTTPALTAPAKKVHPLLSDNFSNNWVIERTHGFATDANGAYVGSSAMVTLLKLSAYYRAPLNNTRSTIDFTRIHTSPSLSRPSFRMQEFYETLNSCGALAQASQMKSLTFPRNFDREFAKVFNLRSTLGNKPIQPFASTDIEAMIPHIKKALTEAKPVVVAQESGDLSPRQHCLSWVIIDGYTEENQFHIVYPRGKDRDFEDQTGWYSLDQLFKEVKTAYIALDFAPLKYPVNPSHTGSRPVTLSY